MDEHRPLSAPAIVGLRAPLRSDIAAVTCHHNWSDYYAPRQNLHRFLRQMERDGIAVYGVELYLAHQRPQTGGLERWRQIRVPPGCRLWQKPALMDAAIRLVPESVPAIVELDADLWFDRADWPDVVLEMLDRHPVGQPFETAVWTGPAGEIQLTRQSAAKIGAGIRPWKGHTGFTWAFRREFYESCGGHYWRCPLGGDDLLWASAILQPGADLAATAAHVGLGRNPGPYIEWAAGVRAALGDEEAGYTPNLNVWHEYHGSRENRRYVERARLLEGFDAGAHIRRRPDGVAEWTDATPTKVMVNVAEYFDGRLEDL